MKENKIDLKDSMKDSYEEEERCCLNCEYLDGLECGLQREEDFKDGENCPKFLAWWNA